MRGKVALVTGGSSGIGRATAIRFARDGCKVVLAARGAERGQQVAAEIAQAGGEALFVATDVSRAADVEQLVAATVRKFGRLDFAVNNAAGYMGAGARTADFSEQEFDDTMAVDLKGVWMGMKHQIQQMLRQDPPGGAIVNVSSVNGLGGVATGSLYAAAKAGILALTKSAAQEYCRAAIRINALVAGTFDTPMLNHSFERASGGDPEVRKKITEQLMAFVAAGRVGLPEEAAAAIVWLCSPEASYVVGHSMIVDGSLSSSFR
jgi:NAD(P)-dependent dehydrogenase (short-subunit alcohol dehydrogenase family)